MDWNAWHGKYDVADSWMERRLRTVQSQTRAARVGVDDHLPRGQLGESARSASAERSRRLGRAVDLGADHSRPPPRPVRSSTPPRGAGAACRIGRPQHRRGFGDGPGGDPWYTSGVRQDIVHRRPPGRADEVRPGLRRSRRYWSMREASPVTTSTWSSFARPAGCPAGARPPRPSRCAARQQGSEVPCRSSIPPSPLRRGRPAAG